MIDLSRRNALERDIAAVIREAVKSGNQIEKLIINEIHIQHPQADMGSLGPRIKKAISQFRQINYSNINNVAKRVINTIKVWNKENKEPESYCSEAE